MRNIEENMFYGASPEIHRRTRELRKRMTPAEKKLWQALRRKQLLGKKFRRQHPLYIYIADFYCHDCKLIIELDGGIHKMPDQYYKDLDRTMELEKMGITVIRFTNEETENNLAFVLKEIENKIVGNKI